jgi:hypothetical protein
MFYEWEIIECYEHNNTVTIVTTNTNKERKKTKKERKHYFDIDFQKQKQIHWRRLNNMRLHYDWSTQLDIYMIHFLLFLMNMNLDCSEDRFLFFYGEENKKKRRRKEDEKKMKDERRRNKKKKKKGLDDKIIKLK